MSKLIAKKQNVQLPKQWRHWMRSTGLKTSVRRHRCTASNFYFGNRQYRFMVGCHNTITMAVQEDFDRWAISRLEGIESPIPRSLSEFKVMIQQMVEQAQSITR
ncbi:MAG: hypothetical protein RSD49_06480 [Hafnia sp.]